MLDELKFCMIIDLKNQRKKGTSTGFNNDFINTRCNQQELSDEKSLEFKHFKTSLEKV
jgi:hypothetical protein